MCGGWSFWELGTLEIQVWDKAAPPVVSEEGGKPHVLQQSRWNDQVESGWMLQGCLFVISGPVGRIGHLKTEPMHF